LVFSKRPTNVPDEEIKTRPDKTGLQNKSFGFIFSLQQERTKAIIL
jgi:hypothetical protein